MARRKQRRGSSKTISMPIVNSHAAAVDIGSRSHFVCVSQDNVKEFGVFTEDLHAICKHFQSYRIETVALESTGFFWKPLFVMLQDYGFEVVLVNARHVKNVKGHKTDVVDSKWLQLLHSLGLLSNSFQPDVYTSQLRTYTRHRKYLVEKASHYITKMNKVLVLMNVQLNSVLRDITGESGLKVIKAILSGERDPRVLSGHVSSRVKADCKSIEKAVVGDWREEYLFELQHVYELYELYWEKIRATDKQIEKLLAEHPKKGDVDRKDYTPIVKKGYQKNDPDIDVSGYAYELSGGVDLTQIPGVGIITLLTLISETGLDLSSFQTAKHFASWLGFTPNKKVSGGKVLSSRTRKKTNPLALAIKNAANSAGNSHSRLGDFFRHLAYRKGRPVAITAVSRKIAVIIYSMLREKKDYLYEWSQGEITRQKNYFLKKVIKTMKHKKITQQELVHAMT